MLNEGQPPQAKGETGQMDEAQDGQHRRTLVVPQANLFQVADRQLDRETRPIELDDLEPERDRSVQPRMTGSLTPSSTTTHTFWVTSRCYTFRTTKTTSVSFP